MEETRMAVGSGGINQDGQGTALQHVEECAHVISTRGTLFVEGTFRRLGEGVERVFEGDALLVEEHVLAVNERDHAKGDVVVCLEDVALGLDLCEQATTDPTFTKTTVADLLGC